MDPMTVLLSALALAGPALKPVADEAVKDAYAGLKALLVSRFGPKNPKLERTIDVHAEDPETFKPSMEQMLHEVGADRDQEVVDAATKLLQRTIGVHDCEAEAFRYFPLGQRKLIAIVVRAPDDVEPHVELAKEMRHA